MGISLRTDCWPLVVTTITGGVTDNDLEQYLASFVEDVLSRREPFASVIDAMQATQVPDARARQRLSRWLHEYDEVGRLHNLGFSLATPSVVVRGGLTAILWLAPPSVPMTSVDTVRLAAAWCVGKLQESKVARSPALDQYLASLDD